MKWFLRIFVILCLFLVGGYNVLHSQPQHHITYGAHHITLPAKAKLTSLAATENPYADYSNAVSFKAKIRGIIDDTDGEDDDETSSRSKIVNTALYQPAVSYTVQKRIYCEGVSRSFPFRDHYLYTSSSRYLLFNVFRI